MGCLLSAIRQPSVMDPDGLDGAELLGPDEDYPSKAVRSAIDCFNTLPEQGMRMLVTAIGSDEPDDLAETLLTTRGLSKRSIGEFVGSPKPFNSGVRQSLLRRLDVAGLTLLEALRELVASFRLPGEAQQIERVLEDFSSIYHEINPDAYTSADVVFVLAFALILLNTDLHSKHVRRRMTKKQFVDNFRRVGSSANDQEEIDVSTLESLYDALARSPLRLRGEGAHYGEVVTFLNNEKDGWLKKLGRGSLAGWKRRWFVVSDNCLYYFLSPENSEPRGIIPLEDLRITLGTGPSGTNIELSSQTGGIRVAKVTAGGMEIATREGAGSGQRARMVLSAESVESARAWVRALRRETTSNPFRPLLQAAERLGTSRTDTVAQPSGSLPVSPGEVVDDESLDVSIVSVGES